MTTNTDNEFAPLKSRFDSLYANDGIWFDPYDPVTGIEYPQFKLAILDTSSDRFREVAERLADRAEANKPKAGFRQPSRLTKKDREREEAITFRNNAIEICFVDWTVENAAGKPVPFTKEKAQRYFDVDDQDKRWLFQECIKFAQNIANYQPDGQDEVPEKN